MTLFIFCDAWSKIELSKRSSFFQPERPYESLAFMI